MEEEVEKRKEANLQISDLRHKLVSVQEETLSQEIHYKQMIEEYGNMVKELDGLKDKYEYRQYITQEVQTELRTKNKHVQTMPI